MWRPIRERLIANHEFYVREAKRRLLDQFNDDSMKADADQYANEWLERRAMFFDPDRDDPGDNYEQAYEENISFFVSLEGLRDNTRLSIIAGMLHEWEKQFRDWLGREFGQHGFGKPMHDAVWMARTDDLFDLMEACGWPVRDRPYFNDLLICLLVVNVYKHGNGRSLDALKALAPAHIANGDLPAFFVSALDYSALSVSDEDLAQFAAAIAAFWHDIPENIFFSQLSKPPRWVQQALERNAAQAR